MLVAISIPIFTSQLEKAKESTDMANIRSAYAEVTAAYLGDNEAHSATVDIESNTGDWKSDADAQIAGVKYSTIIGSSAGVSQIVVAITADGTITIGGQAASATQLDP